MEKLKFWKKEEEAPSELPRPPEMAPSEYPAPAGMEQMGMPTPMPGVTEPPLAPPTGGPFAQQVPQPQAFAQTAMPADQQLQLISSKLDTIKAQLETIMQRLERLEQKNGERPYQQRWRENI